MSESVALDVLATSTAGVVSSIIGVVDTHSVENMIELLSDQRVIIGPAGASSGVEGGSIILPASEISGVNALIMIGLAGASGSA